MKKFTCLLFFALSCIIAGAQFRYEASPEYGKLWDITYDANIPNRVYAITLTNHIMVSDDDGESWRVLYSFPGLNAGISGLKTVPGGRSLSFVVTHSEDIAENGLYVYSLQTNAITHHFVTPGNALSPVVQSYSIYDSMASVVLINSSYNIGLTPYSRTYYSVDAGNSWKAVYFSGTNKNVQVNNVMISPADPKLLYLTLGLGPEGKNGGFRRSPDGGANWTETLSGIPLDPIAINPDNAKDIFAGTGISFGAAKEALYHSVDGGISWQKADIQWNDVTLNNITRITFDPSHSNIIWLLEENEYAASRDGGITWQNKVFPPETLLYYYGTNLSINPDNSREILITSDGFPSRSVDGGKTLTQITNPFYNVNRLAYAPYPSGDHLYYASQGGYLDSSLSAGTTKRYNIKSPFAVNTAIYNFYPDTTTAGRVFLFTGGSDFFGSSFSYSRDYGATATPVPGAGTGFDDNVSAFAKDPVQPNRYWAAFSSFGSGSLYTIDVSRPSQPMATYVSVPSFERIGGVILSKDGKTVSLAQGTKVYQSGDGGTSWTEQSKGLEDLNADSDIIRDMQVNPFDRDEFVLATSQGIYLSTNGGKSWQPVLSGYNLSKARFSSFTPGQILAAQYSGLHTRALLVYSLNGGKSWKEVSPETLGYLSVQAADFQFGKTSANIYFATPDVGVARFTLTAGGDVLPITRLSLTGYLQGEQAQLSWKPAPAANITTYTLERSADGIHFSPVAFVPANASATTEFHYTDPRVTSPASKQMIYYRLQTTDRDGRTEYSEVVPLRPQAANAIISLYPNPVVNDVHLQVTVTDAATYTLSITDMSGRTLQKKQYNLPEGITSLQLSASRLPAGMYRLTLQSKKGQQQFPFTKAN